MWPVAYLRLWPDAIDHQIHLRVFRHIKHQAEMEELQAKEQLRLFFNGNFGIFPGSVLVGRWEGAGSTWSPTGEMKRAPLGARLEMTVSPSHRPNRLEGYFKSNLHHALASRADERIARGKVVRHARIAERAAPLELVPTIDEAG